RTWPAQWPVRILRAGLGLILAGARDLGWRACSADVCFFVDDDNEVASDTLEKIAQAARDKTTGLCAPVIYESDNRDRVWCGGVRRSMWTSRTSFMFRGQSKLPDRREWITDDTPDAFGAPRSVLVAVGGFDAVRFP